MNDVQLPPILSGKDYDHASALSPENLMREARRQRNLPEAAVPEVCLLDPDGDIVRHMKSNGRAVLWPAWACYHSKMYKISHEELEFGVVPCAVGASYAVLVAEQLFASGCRLLISMTSSGQLLSLGAPPYFILIEKALRDEGTSYHYLPPSDFSHANHKLLRAVADACVGSPVSVERGATWTTDAPYRETAEAISRMKEKGLLAVEMEAAALYAFAQARQKAVICFAHVTNQMAQVEGDFEKGDADGVSEALIVVAGAARCLQAGSI